MRKWTKRGEKRPPCREIGHDWGHFPLMVEPDGARLWACLYCDTKCRTPDEVGPEDLEKRLSAEVEAWLKDVTP